MKLYQFLIFVSSLLLVTCNTENKVISEKESESKPLNKGHELVHNMMQKVGDYNLLQEVFYVRHRNHLKSCIGVIAK